MGDFSPKLSFKKRTGLTLPAQNVSHSELL